MAKNKDHSDERSDTNAEEESLHSTDELGLESSDDHEQDRCCARGVAGTLKSRPVIIAAVAAGATAAAVIGVKIACDRHRNAKGYRRAVRHLEDAREVLVEAASELPERGREAVRRVTRR